MTTKTKGCRALDVVQQDYSQTCAAYGAANYRLNTTLQKDIEGLRKRLDELALELRAAEFQQAPTTNGATTTLQVVEEGQPLDGITQ